MSDAVATKVCPVCKSVIPQSATFCPNCGANLADGNAALRSASAPAPGVYPPPTYVIAPPQPSKNKVIAALLGIFLGGIGAHHFYLGNILRGIIYLLLCWTFIPSLLGFIEGILYLATSDAKWIAKYPPVA